MSSTSNTKKISGSAAVVPDMANRVKTLGITTPVPIPTSDKESRHHHHHQHRHQQEQEEQDLEQGLEQDQEQHSHHHHHHLLHKYKSSGDDDENSEDSNDSDACCPRSPVTFGPSPTVDDKHSLARLLKNNRMWSKAIRERQPDFFEKGSKGQQPKVFWIGCSDSRVPENELLQLAPGEVFTHRNIANVVVSTDLNCLSVLQYAVDVLKVEHVVVCGHYGCGGVAAALGDQSYGLIDHWLANIKEVKHQHLSNLNNIQDHEERGRALVEINCRNSVLTVAKSPIMRAAWERGQSVEIIGMVYDIQTGLLSELGYRVTNGEDLATHLKIDSNALFATRKESVEQPLML